jgi:hypothetical protein
MHQSSTCVDDFRDHVGGHSVRSALTGAISIAIELSFAFFRCPPQNFGGGEHDFPFSQGLS